MDTADTKSFDSSHSDITTFTPASTPGVSDDVVVLPIAVSITDGGDGVIEVGSAGGGVENTTGISLESGSVSFNCNRDWSLCDSGHELGGRVSLDGLDGTNESFWSSLAFAVSSLSVSSGVWVFSFGSLTVLCNVVHGI